MSIIEICVYGFLSTFLGSIFIVKTQKWHGFLTNDNTQGVQKFHIKAVPRVGGVTIILAFFLLIFNRELNSENIFSIIFISALPIIFFGILEDLNKNTSVKIRLIATLLSGAFFCILTDIKLTSLNFYFFDSLLDIYLISVLFSAFAISGISNSINIIDGLHGLSSGTSIFILGAFIYISYSVNDTQVFNYSFVLLFIVIGFFIVNFPKGYIFLGDAGAYFLGFNISILAIMFAENNNEISSWLCLLICIYPVTETIFSIYRKFKRKAHSPGNPDKVHLHMLIYKRFSKKLYSPNNKLLNRNAFSALIMLSFPTISFIFAMISINLNINALILIMIFIFIYLFSYKKVTLN